MCSRSHLIQEATFQQQERPAGFDARNKNVIADNYLCQVCMLLLCDPVQLLCGHRVCLRCLHMRDNSVLICVACGIETPRDKAIKDRGCENDMKQLRILCSSCEWSGAFKDYPDHQSACQNETISCQWKRYGCSEQFPRSDTRNHLLSENHQSVMLSLLSPAASDPRQTARATSTASNHQRHPTLNVLVDSVQVLADDIQQQSSKALHTQRAVESGKAAFSQLKVAVEETDALAKTLPPNQEMLKQDFDSLMEVVEDQRVASYDGTFLWRINDVQQKMADAISDKRTSIYSSPFYSAHTGYKMRARLYLNGDGNARRTHLSTFFVLMRGEYDAILEFPFHYKVTFCLYDQTEAQRHIIDSFRPNLKSESFQRPRAEMNIASGIPNFFPLAMLRQPCSPYVLNDTMFIKIIVHFNETSKTIMPFMFTVNPGLPDYVRETMIKEEIEKRAQSRPAIVSSIGTSSTTANTK